MARCVCIFVLLPLCVFGQADVLLSTLSRHLPFPTDQPVWEDTRAPSIPSTTNAVTETATTLSSVPNAATFQPVPHGGNETKTTQTAGSTTLLPPPPQTTGSTTLLPPPPQTNESTTLLPPPPQTNESTTLLPPPAQTNESTTLLPPPPQTNESTTLLPPPPQTNESTTLLPPPPQTNESTTLLPPPPQTNESTTLLPPPAQTNESTTLLPPPAQTNESTTLLPPPAQTNESTTASPPAPTSPPVPEVGDYVIRAEWNVSACLMAKMGLQFSFRIGGNFQTINLDPNPNVTRTSGTCGNNGSDAALVLMSDKMTVQFIFTNQTSKFFLSTLNLTVVMGKSPYFTAVNTNLSLWEASLGSSYMCKKEQSFNITDTLILSTFDLQVQPFGVMNDQFSTAHECSMDDASLLIPIIVGAALAVLILIVVIAYVIGRRKTYVGYQTL